MWLSNSAGTQVLHAGASASDKMASRLKWGQEQLMAHQSHAMNQFAYMQAICRSHDDALWKCLNDYKSYLSSIMGAWSVVQVKQYVQANPKCQYCEFLQFNQVRSEYGTDYHHLHPWSPTSWYQDQNVRNANPHFNIVQGW